MQSQSRSHKPESPAAPRTAIALVELYYPSEEFQYIGVSHDQQPSQDQVRPIEKIENRLNESGDKAEKYNDLEEK